MGEHAISLLLHLRLSISWASPDFLTFYAKNRLTTRTFQFFWKGWAYPGDGESDSTVLLHAAPPFFSPKLPSDRAFASRLLQLSNNIVVFFEEGAVPRVSLDPRTWPTNFLQSWSLLLKDPPLD